MIFVTGATGGIGSELCRLLSKDRKMFRAMCRRADQKKGLQSLGIEALQADFDEPGSLKKAMQGSERLFLLTPPDANHTAREISIIEIAIAAGIRHIVRVSTADANLSARLAYAKSHAEIDHFLRSQPVEWTILRPTGFMQNFVESAGTIAKGFLPHMMGEGQISYIDNRDIARVASCVLTQGSHAKATYFLTGPQSLSVADVADIFSDVLEQSVTDKKLTEDEMRAALRFANLSAWHTDALIEQFRIGAGGGEIDVTEEVERITGAKATSLRDFATDYRQKLITNNPSL